MNRCFFLPLSLLALTLSTSALGECTVEIRKYIGNSGGTKTKAIAKVNGTVSGLRRSPPFAKLSKKEQMELLVSADEYVKEAIADIQSCTETDLASINPSSVTASDGSPKAPSSSATACPKQLEFAQWTFEFNGDGDKYVFWNTGMGRNNPADSGVESLTATANRDPETYGPLVKWAKCHLLANSERTTRGSVVTKPSSQSRTNTLDTSNTPGNSRTASSGTPDSSPSQVNVGNASDATRDQGEVKGAKRGSVASKYVSKDATHCVEIVPKGFKCDGPYDRFLTNICMTKISVRWRLGSDPWGLQELAPKGCTPVSPFRDQRSVQVKACSWDPKASHGPYSDPCRY